MISIYFSRKWSQLFLKIYTTKNTIVYAKLKSKCRFPA